MSKSKTKMAAASPAALSGAAPEPSPTTEGAVTAGAPLPEGVVAVAVPPVAFAELKEEHAALAAAESGEETIEDVLTAATSTTEPDTAPTIEPQPPELAAADLPAVLPVLAAVRDLATARALPEVYDADEFSILPRQDALAIEFFKDDDDRTMQVVQVGASLAKFHLTAS